MGLGAIFVDGGNVSFALKKRSKEQGTPRQRIEYGELVKAIEKRLEINLAFKAYYCAHHDPALLVHREGFYTHLRTNGWSIFDTPSKLCPDGIWRDKGVDMSIGLDAYALALKTQIDTLVLVSHDEDFAELFKRLPDSVRGVSVGFKDRTAMAIQQSASQVLWLEEFQGVIR